MTDDDRLTEQALHDAISGLVPTPPPAPERAAAARTYATRARRGQIVAGVAATAVAAAIVVPFALGNGSDRADRVPQPETSTSPGVVAGDFACPPSPGPRKLLDPDPGPGTLEPDAIAVRICSVGGFPSQPPLDALTTDVDQVVKSVNRLPILPAPEYCDLVGGSPWGMSFQYADGRTRFISGASYGCGGVSVGSVTRGDRSTADRPIALFRRLLWAQRDAATPPPPGAAVPDCDANNLDTGAGLTSMTRQEPLQLTAARLCWRYETESEQPPTGASISTGELSTLVDDLNHHHTGREITEGECVGPNVIHYVIMGVNEWGDRLALDGYCGAFDLSDSNSDIWRPNAESQAIIDRLVAAQPLQIPDPKPADAPDGVLQAWADLLNNGQPQRAAELWVDAAPQLGGDVDHIEMKTEEVRPASAASYSQSRRVHALYREVPTDGSWVDYHERAFTLVRNSNNEPWQILSYVDQGAVATGR